MNQFVDKIGDQKKNYVKRVDLTAEVKKKEN